MVANLVEDLLGCPEVGQIIVTQNIPEQIVYPLNDAVETIANTEPQGYGANQNAAFARATKPFFCVLNPDIRLDGNPFPPLLATLEDKAVALVGPKITAPDGTEEDSARKFPTLRSLLAKALGAHDGTYAAPGEILLKPDWLAGMFLLLRGDAYRAIRGFDENFFLYYEDVDLCWRFRRAGYDILQNRSVAVVHDARRESRRDLRFARWHLASMARYLWKARAF